MILKINYESIIMTQNEYFLKNENFLKNNFYY